MGWGEVLLGHFRRACNARGREKHAFGLRLTSFDRLMQEPSHGRGRAQREEQQVRSEYQGGLWCCSLACRASRAYGARMTRGRAQEARYAARKNAFRLLSFRLLSCRLHRAAIRPLDQQRSSG